MPFCHLNDVIEPKWKSHLGQQKQKRLCSCCASNTKGLEYNWWSREFQILKEQTKNIYIYIFCYTFHCFLIEKTINIANRQLEKSFEKKILLKIDFFWKTSTFKFLTKQVCSWSSLNWKFSPIWEIWINSKNLYSAGKSKLWNHFSELEIDQVFLRNFSFHNWRAYFAYLPANKFKLNEKVLISLRLFICAIISINALLLLLQHAFWDFSWRKKNWKKLRDLYMCLNCVHWPLKWHKI